MLISQPPKYQTYTWLLYTSFIAAFQQQFRDAHVQDGVGNAVVAGDEHQHLSLINIFNFFLQTSSLLSLAGMLKKEMV